MWGLLLAGLGALLVGWSVNHGGICTVRATRDLIERRSPRLTIGIAFAAGTAGLVLLPAAWLWGGQLHLAGSVALGGSLIVGACLLGLGAVVNDACLLGSLGRLGNGELRFLGLPVGLALGSALTRLDPPAIAALPTRLASPTLGGGVVLAMFAVLFVTSGAMLSGDRVHRDKGRRPLLLVMLVFGLCGALLYASRPGWGYADAVQRGFGGAPMAMVAGEGTGLALLTVAGSIGATLLAGRFVAKLPSVGNLARSILGGTLMAFGAARVPGGNDSLLLAAVPSGSVSGIVAYLVMTATVFMLLLATQMLRSRPST